MGSLFSLAWPPSPPPQAKLILSSPTTLELMDTHMPDMDSALTDMLVLDLLLPQQPSPLPQQHSSTHTTMLDKYTQLLNHTSTPKLLPSHTSMRISPLNPMCMKISPPSPMYMKRSLPNPMYMKTSLLSPMYIKTLQLNLTSMPKSLPSHTYTLSPQLSLMYTSSQ